MSDRPWQFSLKHLLAVVLVVGLFFGVCKAAGPLGAMVCLLIAGVLLAILGWRRKSSLSAFLGAALLVVVGLLFPLVGGTVAQSSGRRTVPCEIMITNAETGLPIPAAVVTCRDIRGFESNNDTPRSPIPPGETGISGTTDPQGLVTLDVTLRYNTTTKYDHFTGQESASAFLSIGAKLWIQVEAEGYDTALISLADVVGTNAYDAQRLPFPTLPITLEPTDNRAIAVESE